MKNTSRPGFFDVSTRRKRRQALAFILFNLDEIRIAEQTYFKRIPVNFQSGDVYEATENAIDSLVEAIDILSSVYD